jgi:hypothetical protein
MEQLSHALLGVKACLVPFRAVLGVFVDELEQEAKHQNTMGVLSWAACGVAMFFAPPLFIFTFGSFVYHGEKLSRTREQQSKFSNSKATMSLLSSFRHQRFRRRAC